MREIIARVHICSDFPYYMCGVAGTDAVHESFYLHTMYALYECNVQQCTERYDCKSSSDHHSSALSCQIALWIRKNND